jgi:formate dehydrogenase assembly factor FdhD
VKRFIRERPGIKLNGVEFATLVCTPEYLEDVLIGYLASENVIKTMSDYVTALQYRATTFKRSGGVHNAGICDI